LTFWVGDRNKIDCTQLHNREGRANQPGFVVFGAGLFSEFAALPRTGRLQ
jgi:hypothetical protein